jgi:hypothetical protein
MTNKLISKRKIDRVVAKSFPKTIYLWPTLIIGMIIWIVNSLNTEFDFFTGQNAQNVNALFATIWLLFIAFNLIIMSFDFSLGKTFSIFITIIVITLGYVLLRDANNIELLQDLPSLKEILLSINIYVDPIFYLLFSLILMFIYIVTFIQTRFVYWEFQSNRIIHHRGIFEREESFSAQQSRVITQTTDIFERLLFRAGTIYIIDSDKNVHKLENVYDAGGKDSKIQELMSTINVKTD